MNITNLAAVLTITIVTNVTEKPDIIGYHQVPCPDAQNPKSPYYYKNGISCLVIHREPDFSPTDKTITETVDEVRTVTFNHEGFVYTATNWIQKSSKSWHVAEVKSLVTNAPLGTPIPGFGGGVLYLTNQPPSRP